MMEPNTLWVAIAPGVMELPTTKFRITYRRLDKDFILSFDGMDHRSYGTLRAAKEGAARWMTALMEMGIEV